MDKKSLDLEKMVEWLVEYFDKKDRAKARIPATTNFDWFFGIVGLKCDVEEFEFDTAVRLHRVAEPPGLIELFAALKDSGLAHVIARYSGATMFELAIKDEMKKPEGVLRLGQVIFAAIRARSLAQFLVPAALSHSWSTIAGIEENSCEAILLEDALYAPALPTPSSVTRIDLEWVQANLMTFVKLLSNPRFMLAVFLLDNYTQVREPRMVVTSLWSGIEAVIGVQMELRFRVASYLASILQPRGPDRAEFYKRLKTLYDMRSKVVHGSRVSSEDVVRHIIDVRQILSKLLCEVVRQGKVPSESDYERSLFEE